MASTRLSSFVFLFVASLCFAQVKEAAPSGEQAAEKELFDARHEFMFKQAKTYKGTRADGVKITPCDEHLLLWTNPYVGIEHGLLVGWKDADGRPMAAAQIYVWPNTEKWNIELHSLSQKSQEFTSPNNKNWSPKGPAIEWTKLLYPPPVAKAKKLQMSQLRQIARRFHAVDVGAKNRRYRFLSSPVYSYDAPKQGVLQGAMFVFASGTDPELLLLIELREDRETNTKAHHWALARMNRSEMKAYLDDEVVWHEKWGGNNSPSRPFFTDRLNTSERFVDR